MQWLLFDLCTAPEGTVLLELALMAVVGTTSPETAAPQETTPDIPLDAGGGAVEQAAPAAAELPVAPVTAPLTVPLPKDEGALAPSVPAETQMLPPAQRVIEARLVEDAPAVVPAKPEAPVAQVAAQAASEAPKRRVHTQLGLTLDAGVPDGVGVAAVYRPFDWVRLHGGYTQNGIGHGLKGGATLVPFIFPVLPSLTVEAGHLFAGDAALLEKFGVSVPEELRDSFSYNFYSAHLGLEVGSQNRFLLFLRGGLSRVNATVGALERTLREQTGSSTLEADPAKLRAGLPSAKVGLIVFFL